MVTRYRKTFEQLLVDSNLREYKQELYFIWFNYWIAKTKIMEAPSDNDQRKVYQNYIDFIKIL